MINAINIKLFKDVVITGTPERLVLSGGSITLHRDLVTDKAEVKQLSIGGISIPIGN